MTKNQSFFRFGDRIQGVSYPVLNEREVRASAGILFLVGLVAFINGFILRNAQILPYLLGSLLLNFLIGVFINPRFAPSMLLARFFVQSQKPLYIGAIQKKFAWGLGILLLSFSFYLSIRLVTIHPLVFPFLCALCFICLTLMFFESALGICIGCELYHLAIRLRIIKKPKVAPNCTGDSCEI